MYVLKRKTTVIIFTTGDNFSILLTSCKIKSKNGQWDRAQYYAKGTVINTEWKPSTISVESIINLRLEKDEMCWIPS